MRSVIIATVFFICFGMLNAQQNPFASRVIEYRPAPGQYINDPASGTPTVAKSVLNEPGQALSLGAYGGYIILGFDHRIMNDPANPYGIDFTVFGNPVQTLAEQGIIRIMKDDNNNGIPDDTWYEIAGADHFTGKIKRNYSITYYNPVNSSSGDVPWKDNSGNSGFIFKNSFHTQAYYPDYSLFQQINKDSIGFTGSLLAGNVKQINGLFVSLPSAFGYADNTPVNTGNIYTIPDNPYTLDVIEGSGGDAIDISWAVDVKGNYIELDGIDFVMIYTGINSNAGWLGEISTEIRGVADVATDARIQGQINLILPLNFPEKISVPSVLTIRSLFFERGRIKSKTGIEWISSDNSVAVISNDSVITSYRAGTINLSARLKNTSQNLFVGCLKVCTPTELKVENIPAFIRKDQVFTLKYSILDNEGDRLAGVKPEISITGQDFLKIINVDEEKLTLQALKAGEAYINFSFAGLNQSRKIQISDIPKEFEVSVSITKDTECIIPRKKYSVSRQDLPKYTDRMEEDFIAGRNFISVADVIVSVLLHEGYGSGSNSFRFRQDYRTDHKLYLWQFGRNYEYTYGWGGTGNNVTYAKTWIAIVNNNAFANGWDTIEIKSGDIISFRHVIDFRNNWNQIQLVPEKQVSLPGEEIKFTVRQLQVSRNEKNEFVVAGPLFIPDAKVLVNENHVLTGNSILVSDLTGEFKLKFNTAGKYSVAVENANSEQTQINVEYTLGDYEFDFKKVKVFPNPFINEVHIKTENISIKLIKIFRPDGRIVKEIIPEDEDLNIDFNGIENGAYILEFRTGESRFNRIVIKNQP